MPSNNTINPIVTPRRAGFAASRLAQDGIAGLTLAAIAIPEQMATARLAHFPPEMGFLAFLAGTLGFLLFGASRVVSVGADSTIAPILPLVWSNRRMTESWRGKPSLSLVGK